MKFCDKLPKLRKEHNLSQENLAEKLNVSRQAVSKWESGSSYPDMEKMIEMCRILNCTLEDLLDDGTIGKKRKDNKEEIGNENYIESFFKYVTKIYNMFTAMSFKQKISFFFEMTIAALLLFVIGGLIYMFIDNIIFIPLYINYITFMFRNLLTVFLSITGLVIFIHIFKIRYLDYYITIEDNTIEEKIVEKEIDEKKVIKERKKEVIIIRDPKDKKYNLFNFINNIWIIFLKIFTSFMLMGVTSSFIVILISIVIIGYFTIYHIMFLFVSLFLVGILLLNSLFIYIFFNFIFNRINNKKFMFISLIVAIIVMGINIGITTISILNIEYYESDFNELETKIQTKEYTLEEIEIFIKEYELQKGYYINTNIIFDNDINQSKVEFQTKTEKFYFEIIDDYYYTYYNGNTNVNEMFNFIIDNLKNNKLPINFEDLREYNEINVYISEENYNNIKEKLNIN